MRAVLFRFALPLLAVAALVPAAQDAWRRITMSSASPGVDYLQRFAPFRAHLDGVRLVSYVCDPADFVTLEQASDPGAAARAQRAVFEVFLAQRALAPTLVRAEPNADWALLNYRDRARVPDDWPQRGLDMVADPGTGAVLFKLKGK